MKKPNVTVFFDGLMVFTRGDSLGKRHDYHVKLLTKAHGHEVRIAAYKNGSTQPYPDYLFSHEAIRMRFEHLWLYVANKDGSPVEPDISAPPERQKLIDLKDYVGISANQNPAALCPVLHLRNGLLTSDELRPADCLCFSADLVIPFMNILRQIAHPNGALEAKFKEFKQQLAQHPPTRIGKLPRYVRLDLTLGEGQTLRLVSGDAQGPQPNGTLLLEITPGAQDQYRIDFANTPPAEAQQHAPRHQLGHTHSQQQLHEAVLTYHFLHYYDAFNNANTTDRLLLVEEDVPTTTGSTPRLGPYPMPPCLCGGDEFP